MFRHTARTLSNASSAMESHATTLSMDEASHYFCDAEMENAPSPRRRKGLSFFPFQRAGSASDRSATFSVPEESALPRPPHAVTIITNIGDSDSLVDRPDGGTEGEAQQKDLSESRGSTCTTHSQSTASSNERYFCAEVANSGGRSHCGSLGYSLDSRDKACAYEEFPWHSVSGDGEFNDDDSLRHPEDCYDDHDVDAVPSQAQGTNPCFQLPLARFFSTLFRDKRGIPKNDLRAPMEVSFQSPLEL